MVFPELLSMVGMNHDERIAGHCVKRRKETVDLVAGVCEFGIVPPAYFLLFRALDGSLFHTAYHPLPCEGLGQVCGWSHFKTTLKGLWGNIQ